MASAIETVKAENRTALARQKEKTRRLQHTLVRKATLLTTAATIGTMNRYGVPVAVGGFPWKPLVALGATIAEATTKGNWQAGFGGVADATMVIYTERAISTNNVVAGAAPSDDDVIDVEGHETHESGGELD